MSIPREMVSAEELETRLRLGAPLGQGYRLAAFYPGGPVHVVLWFDFKGVYQGLCPRRPRGSPTRIGFDSLYGGGHICEPCLARLAASAGLMRRILGE